MAELKKVLSYRVILLITINAIMGTGIFFLPAIGAREAGAASIISWIILSFIAIYIAMCFGELSSMYPKSGGVYEFCKHAYGRFSSFLTGWMTIIAGNITIAMLVVGAIHYLIPGTALLPQILLSLIFVFIFNYIAFRGMKTSAVMLIAFAFITLIALFGLIFPGLIHLNPDNFIPFFAKPKFMILIAIFFIAETFFGWETATFLAEETKDGEKVMPKALIWGTIIIAIISLLVVVSSVGAMRWDIFAQSTTPLKDLAFIHYGARGQYIFTLLVYLAIIGSVAGWIVSAPRLLLAMARDKLFLKQVAAIHPKYNTPHKAILFQTVLTTVIVIVGAGSYEILLTLLVPIVLIMYAAVLISLTVLRFRNPSQKRYYKAPLGKVGPILCALFLISLIVIWIMFTKNAWGLLKIGISFIILGTPIYLLLEMYYDPKAIKKVNNFFAYTALLTENISLPKKLRREIIILLGNIKGKTVLELGCSVGTLTKYLAKEVGKQGEVIATDISIRDINIAKRRMKRFPHVEVLHHDDANALHPKIPNVDAVISVGTIGYIQQVSKVLKELNKKLDVGDKICFLEYDRFFWIIPNIPWLNKDSSIKNVFAKSGFEINVIRKSGWFWQYLYIYGRKNRDVE